MIKSIRIGATYTNFRQNRFRKVEFEILGDNATTYRFGGKTVQLVGTGRTYQIIEVNNKGQHTNGHRFPIRESVLLEWAHREIKSK